MKKYILVVFGEVNNYEISKDIVMNVVPIVDSKLLKYQITKGAIVFHFATEVSFEELTDYIGGIMNKYYSFILSEYSDKMTLMFPSDIMEHLLNLEDDDKSEVTFYEEDDDEDEDFDEEAVAKLIKEIKKNVKKPSLDNILEKIQESGIDSLSQFEKDTLEEYSKN